MPPRQPRNGGRLRRVLVIAALTFVGAGAVACFEIGPFLYDEDALRKADAICVLAGTRMERPLEAADLYAAGWAPRIVLTQDLPDPGIIALEQRGLEFPTNAEIARDALVRLGVPTDAIVIPPELHDSTADESATLRRLARDNGWRRMIVVTSKYHTRRTGFALRRRLKGMPIEVVVRGSRYDPADPPHWWRTRAGVRWVTSEAQKLLVYALGVGM